MLEDNLNLPGNGKLYSKVISWVQRSLWKNGEPLEKLMEEVSIVAFFFYPFLSLAHVSKTSVWWLTSSSPLPLLPRVFALNLVNFAVRAPQNTEKLVFQVSRRLSLFSPLLFLSLDCIDLNCLFNSTFSPQQAFLDYYRFDSNGCSSPLISPSLL